MLKKTALTVLSILATTSAMADITNKTVQDFLKGAGLGAAHGLFNKTIAQTCEAPYAAQALTFVVAASIQDEMITGARYNHRPIALQFGHALAQGLVEGSDYNHATKEFRPGFSFNLMSLVVACNHLWNNGVRLS